MTASDLQWATASEDVQALVAFFLRNVDLAYISHGEVQSGRAESVDRWSPKLAEILARELGEGLEPFAAGARVAVGRDSNGLCAIALLTFAQEAGEPFAVLQDLVVRRDARGHGTGARVVEWIEAEARRLGARALFLESGAQNERAHDFFERRSYRTVSVVMCKSLV